MTHCKLQMIKGKELFLFNKLFIILEASSETQDDPEMKKGNEKQPWGHPSW